MLHSCPSILYLARDVEADRIQFMEDWLHPSGISYERLSGVDVKEVVGIDNFYLRDARLARFGYDLSDGEIGCFLAHRSAWERCVQIKKPVIVLENDVIAKIPDNLPHLIAEIPKMLEVSDLIRLYGIFEKNERMRRVILRFSNEYKLIQSMFDPMGGQAYCVTPHAATVLLSYSAQFFEPVDVFLANTWRHRLRFRTVKPYPFETREFASEIGDRRRPQQSTLTRLTIESKRAFDDLKRILYLPINYLR